MTNIKEVNELTIYITGRCNLDCDYCLIERSSLLSDRLSLSVLRKALDLFLKTPGKEKAVTFLGGEPLLEHKLMINSINYARRLAKKYRKIVYVSVITNGFLLNRLVYDNLKKNNIAIGLSLDGNQDSHNRHRKLKTGKGSFQTIMKNIKKIDREELKRIRAMITYTPQTFINLVDNINFLCKLGFERIKISPQVGAFWKKEHLVPLEKVYRDLVDYYVNFFKINNRRPFKIHCWPIRLKGEKAKDYRGLALDTGGNFYPSFFPLAFVKKTTHKYIIGDYKTEIDLKKNELFYQEAFSKICQMVKNKCQRCPISKTNYCFRLFLLYIQAEEADKSLAKNFRAHCQISRIHVFSLFEIEQRINSLPLDGGISREISLGDEHLG